MSKQLASAAISAFLFCAPAMATTVTPVISGKYRYTWVESCFQNHMIVGTSQTVGILDANAATKTVTLNALQSGGNPPTLSHISGSGSYANTSTTFSIHTGSGTKTYQAFYGKITNGI